MKGYTFTGASTKHKQSVRRLHGLIKQRVKASLQYLGVLRYHPSSGLFKGIATLPGIYTVKTKTVYSIPSCLCQQQSLQ